MGREAPGALFFHKECSNIVTLNPVGASKENDLIEAW